MASMVNKHQQFYSHLNQQPQQQQQTHTGTNQSSAIYHANKQINVLFFGLQMLGFDLAANEKEYSIKLNAQTFAKPNQKAFDVLVHFLLCQLDAERGQRTFQHCWPSVLRDQQRDFKEAILVWLQEIASLTNPSTGMTTSTSASSLATQAVKQQQQTHATNKKQPQQSQHQSLLQHIKFPSINKSFFMSLGGPHSTKVWELLSALTEYVYINQILQLVDSENINEKINPKMSGHALINGGHLTGKEPFSTASSYVNAAATQVNQAAKSAPPAGSSLSMSVYTRLCIMASSQKRRISANLIEFNEILNAFIKQKREWTQYSNEKHTRTLSNFAKNGDLNNRIAMMREMLTKPGKSESIESALEIKYEKFERNWLRLNALCDESIASVDKMAKIEHMLNDDSASRMELDGMRFSSAFKDQNDVNERVFKLVYQHLDNNAEIRNAELAELLHGPTNQLDLINLARLYNVIINLKGEILMKVDRHRLNNVARALTGSDQSELANNYEISTGTLKLSNKQLNEAARKLKQKLDAYLPGLIDKACNRSSSNIRNELTSLQQFDQGIGKLFDLNVENNALCFIDDYFDLSSGPTINKKLMTEMRTNIAGSSVGHQK